MARLQALRRRDSNPDMRIMDDGGEGSDETE
jgi:hypothetical protein